MSKACTIGRYVCGIIVPVEDLLERFQKDIKETFGLETVLTLDVINGRMRVFNHLEPEGAKAAHLDAEFFADPYAAAKVFLDGLFGRGAWKDVKTVTVDGVACVLIEVIQPRKTQVVVEMESGVLENVYATGPAKAVVIDSDLRFTDDTSDIVTIAGKKYVLFGDEEATIDPARVAAVRKVVIED